jgi:hypothetical protein
MNIFATHSSHPPGLLEFEAIGDRQRAFSCVNLDLAPLAAIKDNLQIRLYWQAIGAFAHNNEAKRLLASNPTPSAMFIVQPRSACAAHPD